MTNLFQTPLLSRGDFDLQGASATTRIQRPGYQFNHPPYHQFSDLVNSSSPQVFFFSYSRINTQSSAEVVIHEDCLVQVETSDDGKSENDLISRLTSSLSRYHDSGSEHDVIIEPSEVIPYHLRNTRSATSANASALLNQKPVKYPMTLSLDWFSLTTSSSLMLSGSS